MTYKEKTILELMRHYQDQYIKCMIELQDAINRMDNGKS